MPVPTTVFADPAALGEALAARIAEEIQQAGVSGRPYVLGCPGGRTPVTTYAALARLVAERRLDVGHVVIAMMDEYVVPGPRLVDPELPYSCRRFGREHLAEPLGIADDRLLLPTLEDGAYDKVLDELGGIDLFLLASGASDGHVGFNPQGSPLESTTRVVDLAEATRRDNLGTFPVLGTLDRVPRHGVTVGIDTIRRHSKSAVMMVHGAHKAEAAARLRTASGYNPEWPATVVAECANASLYVDQAAIG